MDFEYCVFDKTGRYCLAECKTLHIAKLLARALSLEEENLHERIFVASYDNGEHDHAIYVDGEDVMTR